MTHSAPEFDAADPIPEMFPFHRAQHDVADAAGRDEPVAEVPRPGEPWTAEAAEAFIARHAPAVAGAMAELERALRVEYPDASILVYHYTAWTLGRYLSPRGTGDGQPLGCVSVTTRSGITAGGTVLVRWRDGRVLIERHPPITG